MNPNWTVVCCGMLMDEYKKVVDEQQVSLNTIWMRRALHNQPQVLEKSIQSIIDEHQDCEAILFTYGLCGNGLCGIRSEHTRLVIPRFHDCIHQLLYNVDNDSENDSAMWKTTQKPGHMYLTRGWTLDKESIYCTARSVLRTYGEHEGAEILNRIYQGYDYLDVIDTQSYDMEDVMKNASQAAELCNMKVRKIKGSTVILKKLVTGDWDHNFIILEPGEVLTLAHFGIQ